MLIKDPVLFFSQMIFKCCDSIFESGGKNQATWSVELVWLAVCDKALKSLLRWPQGEVFETVHTDGVCW